MEWISKEEVLNILGEDYEPVINESKIANKDKSENALNTPSVTHNTPVEIARKYKKYFDEYIKIEKKFAKIKILAMEHSKILKIKLFNTRITRTCK